jgi:hypothetical protein
VEVAAEEAAMAVVVVAVAAVVVVAGQAGWAVVLPPGRAVPVFAPTVGTRNNTWWVNRVTRNNALDVALR